MAQTFLNTPLINYSTLISYVGMQRYNIVIAFVPNKDYINEIEHIQIDKLVVL